ncbi:hypothetical protein DFH27DRAFT_534113 [Peziza echinospora]|nr:hypothetical protein DFH27DRAFT_534113 [Peziza echinospora]
MFSRGRLRRQVRQHDLHIVVSSINRPRAPQPQPHLSLPHQIIQISIPISIHPPKSIMILLLRTTTPLLQSSPSRPTTNPHRNQLQLQLLQLLHSTASPVTPVNTPTRPAPSQHQPQHHQQNPSLQHSPTPRLLLLPLLQDNTAPPPHTSATGNTIPNHTSTRPPNLRGSLRARQHLLRRLNGMPEGIITTRISLARSGGRGVFRELGTRWRRCILVGLGLFGR